MNNPLYDKEFLKELDKFHTKNTYARITSLTWNEEPLTRIDGRITAGTVNIDGSSAVRRTCSLTMLTNDINIKDYEWGLQSKFKLEVGLENVINSNYPEIIWFPQGTFILTGFNTTINANNCTIALQGKDKMCMLNGDLGGSLHSQIDFGIEEYYDIEKQETQYNSIPIETIIRNAVNVYGNEPLHNIIINDLDQFGLELLEYRGDDTTPLFLLREVNSSIYINMTMRKDQPCYKKKDDDWVSTTIGELKYLALINEINDLDSEADIIKLQLTDDALEYQVYMVVYGDEVGYRPTELTYAGDLIANVGESLTSVLDKIKNMLGNFEYFYDLEGRFIFQKKKTYVNSPWNSIVKTDNDMYVEAAAYTSSTVYNFNNSNFFTAITHNPAFNNLKNDFSVWGVRKGVTGADIPIHVRYSLNRKPIYYKNYNNQIFVSEEFFGTKENNYITVDWRELIYQMAEDYYNHHDEDDFFSIISQNNYNYYPTGHTGYEFYYTDMEGFWRELYNPFSIHSIGDIEPDPIIQYYQKDEEGKYKEIKFEDITTLKSLTDGERYYILEDGKYLEHNGEFVRGKKYFTKVDEEYIPYQIYVFNSGAYYYSSSPNHDPNTGWNFNVTTNPAVLNFWFDFIGENSQMDNYLIDNIGLRSKALNDSNVTGVYFKQVPEVLFITEDEYNAMIGGPLQSGYTYIRINDSMSNFFSISSQGKSAHDVIEELLTNNTYCIENLTITSIPIYYLQPNNRIEIYDSETRIEGEYLVSKITLPLTYNGTMSITATKAVDTIY